MPNFESLTRAFEMSSSALSFSHKFVILIIAETSSSSIYPKTHGLVIIRGFFFIIGVGFLICYFQKILDWVSGP